MNRSVEVCSEQNKRQWQQGGENLATVRSRWAGLLAHKHTLCLTVIFGSADPAGPVLVRCLGLSKGIIKHGNNI